MERSIGLVIIEKYELVDFGNDLLQSSEMLLFQLFHIYLVATIHGFETHLVHGFLCAASLCPCAQNAFIALTFHVKDVRRGNQSGDFFVRYI
ncbi:hypothetical protein D3C84_1009770 [compost metagenome]